MADPFATEADLAAWLAEGPYPVPAGDAATRVLTRASELVDWCSTGTYTTDPVDVAVTDALMRATCAQVEQWLEVGEESDIAGYPDDTYMSSGGLSINRQPAKLAPRAARILETSSLLNSNGAAIVGGLQPPIGADIV